MFFPEKIVSISDKDRVLEVGPGGTPYARADVFLEKKYIDKTEARGQRGNVDELITDKPVIYYDGNRMPFSDKEFDYVICSHVLEHVDDVSFFVKELTRVADKGYIEFPTICYEYLYNFSEHKNFMAWRDGVIVWLPKKETDIDIFRPVTDFYRTTLESSYTDMVNSLKSFMFCGFEWQSAINVERTTNIRDLMMDYSGLKRQTLTREDLERQIAVGSNPLRRVARKLKRAIKNNTA
jgi:hypothetical protein